MTSPLPVPPEERERERVTNYRLANELLTVGEWIAKHSLTPGGAVDALLTIGRAVDTLRGIRAERITNLDDLLRNDAWAHAIAMHVRAQTQVVGCVDSRRGTTARITRT